MASLTKNTQNKMPLMGVFLGNFMRPCGTEADKCEFSRRRKGTFITGIR